MTGCGGDSAPPSPKQEAKALHNKYFGAKGLMLTTWRHIGTAEDGTQAFYDEMIDWLKQCKKIENQLVNEKVSKDVEPLKNAMLTQSKHFISYYELTAALCKEALEQKKNPAFANMHFFEVEKKIRTENPKFANLNNDIFWIEFERNGDRRRNEYQKITGEQPPAVTGMN